MADESVKFKIEAEDKASSKIQAISGTLGKLAGLAVAAFSAKAIYDFGTAAIKSAEEAQLLGNQLLNAVKNSNQFKGANVENADAIKEVTQNLKILSGVLQEKSTFDDEAILQAETRLVQAGAETDAIKVLIPAIMDKIAATESLENQDAALVATTEGMMKALNGTTDSLTRLGIPLSDVETKQFELMNTQERAALIAEKLNEKYKGAAQDSLSTTAGATKAMAEQWANFQQDLGILLLPIVEGIVKMGVDILAGVKQFLADLKLAWDSDWMGIRTTVEGIINWFNNEFLPAFDAFILGIQEAFAPIIQFFQDHWAEIQAIWNVALGILKAAWDAFWVAIKTAFSVAWEIIKGLIKTALALLAGDWKGAWETIQAMFKNIWDAMKIYVEQILNSIVTFLNDQWTNIKTALSSFYAVVKAGWDAFWNGLASTVSGIINQITKWINDLIGLVSNAVKSLKGLTGEYVSPGTVKTSTKKKAGGGPLMKDEFSLVGEKGPELFLPSTSGKIIPNNALSSSKTFIFNFNGPVSGKEIALEYADMVIRELKLSNAIV